MRVTADTSWDVTIEVGRWSVPTLSPLMVGEADALRTQTRPGVFVRLWRWLFGEKRPAAETEQVRRLVEQFTPETYRNVTDQMNGGELAALYSAYMGAQAAWVGRMRAEAEEAAEREGTEARRHEGTKEMEARAGNTVMWPATPLRAGPVPAVLHGLGVNEVNGRPVEEARIGSREVANREEQRHA